MSSNFFGVKIHIPWVCLKQPLYSVLMGGYQNMNFSWLQGEIELKRNLHNRLEVMLLFHNGYLAVMRGIRDYHILFGDFPKCDTLVLEFLSWVCFVTRAGAVSSNW